MSVVNSNHIDEDEYEDNEEEEEMEAWIAIQDKTFTNWVNDKLKGRNEYVSSLKKNFKDGTLLCVLIEVLSHKTLPGRINRPKKKGVPLNHYEASGNMELAFNAMKYEGVRLVNIGAEDIRSGNLKLILGMIWTLIRKYQIGSTTKAPAKKLMLAWINALLHPHLTVSNFNRDWNDGRALKGIVEFCSLYDKRQSVFPNWHQSNVNDPTANCREAMEAAESFFHIPIVISPDNFSSPNLDELSGMTYISYFMHEGQDGIREAHEGVRSCGYQATLNFVNELIGENNRTSNFDIDWNNGFRACALSVAVGGNVPGFPNMPLDNDQALCDQGIRASEELGIPRVISGKDMADKQVDHLGPMAFAAWHRIAVKNKPKPAAPPTPVPKRTGADIQINVPTNRRINNGFTVLADTSSAGDGTLTAEVTAPSGLTTSCPVQRGDRQKFDVGINPTEKGKHMLHVFYDGIPVRGSPYPFNIFDVGRALVLRQQNDPIYINDEYKFQVDIQNVGVDELEVYVFNDGKAQDSQKRPVGIGIYEVTFVPQNAGQFVVNIYCGGYDIDDSAFTVQVVRAGNVTVRGEGLRQAFTNRVALFEVDASEVPDKVLETKIYNPGGRMLKAELLRNSNNPNLYRIQYFPVDVGTHQVEIFYGNDPVPGGPFYVNVKDPQVYVRNLDVRCAKNREARFLIDATEMQDGTIEIDSGLQVKRYQKLDNKLYEVTIVPQEAGMFDIVISIANRQVNGSPFEVEVLEQ